MKLRPRALDCPSCGASIEVRHAVKAKTIVCSMCGAQIDLTKPGFEVLGKIGREAEAPVGFVKLGMHASVDDEDHEVIGRLRYREDDSFWDEWLLLSERGHYIWFSEDEGRFAIHRVYVPKEPPDPNDIKEGARVRIDGRRPKVEERGEARLAHIEGEMTWRARVGDVVQYADLASGGTRYSIEWSDEEIEYYRTKRVARAAARVMFGLSELDPAIAAQTERVANLRKVGVSVFVAGLVVAVLAMVGGSLGSTLNESPSPVKIQKSNLAGLALAELDLSDTGFYGLSATVRMPKGMNTCYLWLVDDGGQSNKLMSFEHVGSVDASGNDSVRFRVDKAGHYHLALSASASSLSSPGEVTWTVKRGWVVPLWFWLLSVVFIVLGLRWLVTAASEESAARFAMNAMHEENFGYDEDD